MEGTIILVVLLYFAFICLDFAVPEIVRSAEGGLFTDAYQQFIISWSRVFWLVDLIFLSIFLVEICLRVYAWGSTYLRDWLNVIDAIIVMASFGMYASRRTVSFRCQVFAAAARHLLVLLFSAISVLCFPAGFSA